MSFNNNALNSTDSTPNISINGGSLGAGDLVVDAWGIQKVSLPISLFHGLWTFDISPSMWFQYTNGTQVYSGTDVTSIFSAANINTSTTSTSVIMESRQCPRYQPNRGHLFSTALWCPDKTNDGTRDWGLCTDDNGVGFRLKSDGLLYAIQRSGGVETKEEVIDTSVLNNFNVEKGNIYDIQYQWRGVGNYFFYIGDTALGASKLVHTFNYLNDTEVLTMENPALPIRFKSVRGTEDVKIKVGCADITSENGIPDKEQYSSCFAENVAVTTDTPVLIASQPLLINTQINTRTVTFARLSVTCSKKATFKVWVTRDPDNITGATFAAIGSGSFIETDSPDTVSGAVRATAVTTANLRHITNIPVEAASARSIDNPNERKIDFDLVRGDYLIITCSAATANAECVLELGEQV